MGAKELQVIRAEQCECAHAEFAIKEVVIKSKVVVTLNQKSKIWGYKS